MSNELIVYRPKKKIHKIILKILLGLLICFAVFCISVYSSALISSKSKWNSEKDVDLVYVK
ncbi:MAG: hypothetical protein IJ690_04615 [Clostridia bacterium]|nr:hypothetical protein [Clostridia bacterium]